MSYDFSHSVDRTGSRAEKWDRGNMAGICGNADALPFWVADMDLPVSDGIRQAIEDEARLGVIGYRNNSALRPAFISFMKERHDTVLDEDHVAFAQGMLHAIALAMNIFTKEGDRILLPYPSYHPFIDMIEDNGRIIVPYQRGHGMASPWTSTSGRRREKAVRRFSSVRHTTPPGSCSRTVSSRAF